MSMRGVKYQFQPGESVLCFEPDHTKARVLYNAKVLDLAVGRGSDGTRKPDYLVHFQGWNSSWDRIVSETLILSNSEENKQLMKLLASTARKIKTNRRRKKKIESLLTKHLKFNSDLAVEYSDASGESSKEESDSDIDCKEEIMRSLNDEILDFSDNEISFKDQSMVYKYEEEVVEEEECPVRDVHLDLPAKLKKILEEDCFNIVKNEQSVQLPADPNIINILEGYVKNFIADLVYTSKERKITRRERDQKPKTQKNIELIKEIVDGLRVLFDFSVEPLLLYNVEKDCHKQLVRNYVYKNEDITDTQENEKKPKPTTKLKCVEPLEEVQSPRLRSAAAKSTSTANKTDCSSPNVVTSCSSPRPVRSSPRGASGGTKLTAVKKEPQVTDSEDDTTSPHRHTRQKYLGSVRKRKAVDSESPVVKEKSAKKTALNSSKLKQEEVDEEIVNESRRGSLRSSHKVDDGLSSTSFLRQQSGENSSKSTDVKKSSLKDRVIPPPPLQVNNLALSSKESTASSQNTPNPVSDSSSSMVFCNGYKTKEAVMNHIFDWKLIPKEVYEMSPVPPSVVYGAHHLLRLFVRLPEILGKMAIPDKKFNILMEHVELFIQYLEDRNEELFLNSVYV